MGRDMRGTKNPFYGKHHSLETRKRFTKTRTGKPQPWNHKHTEETKHKISLANTGQKHPNRKYPEWFGERISAGKRTPLPETEVINLYESGLSSKAVGEKYGVWEGVILRRLQRLGVPRRKRTCQLHTEESKRKSRLALQSKPNRVEERIQRFCITHQIPLRYVGNGEVWIGKRNPDFIDYNGRKIVVEIFSDYWHSPLKNPNVQWNRTVNPTMKAYKKYGFDCKIGWDNQLKSDKDIETFLSSCGYNVTMR